MNKVDLDCIMKKAMSYRSLDEFRTDIAWFVHNCKIAAPRNFGVQKAAEKLLDWVDGDIFILRACLECYENSIKSPDTSFTMICNPSHILIWAKIGNLDFWPAKAMSAANGMVDVWFFGDHTRGEVTSSLCYLYSAESPDGSDFATDSECAEELIEKTKQVSLLQF